MGHPNIVTLHDFVEANPETDEPAFMVMEFLPGHDLARVIAKKGPLAIQRAVDRIVQACGAVSACHRLGYVHRDLKPNNIFLVEYDQIEITKVLDFGAAKAEDRPEGQGGDQPSELTKKGTYIGTPFYMPPELIAGGLVTPAADQYALAVVLYQALAGIRPFDYDKEKKELDDVELLRTIVNGQYKPLREHRREVPEGLAAVIKKGMEVKPSNRYLDLHAFGGALLRWASPEIRLMWEKHFTSSAPAKIDPKMSIALLVPPERTSDRESSAVIEASTNVDSTEPPLEGSHNTSPTVNGERDPMLTIPLGTKELRLAGASVATTAVQDPNSPPSISIEFHDPDAAPAAEGSSTPLNTRTPRPSGGLLRRPGVILAAAAAALGLVLAVSIALSRAKPASPKAPSPAPELFARPVTPPTAPSPPPVAASGRTDCCSRAGCAPQSPSRRRSGVEQPAERREKAAGAQAPQATNRRQKRYRHSV